MKTMILVALMLGQPLDKLPPPPGVDDVIVASSPQDAVAKATADIGRVPVADRFKTRYISLHGIPAKERQIAAGVLSVHVNSLSRGAGLIAPFRVDDTLVRVRLNDYGWTSELWSKLADPEFAIIAEKEINVPWDGGTWPDDGKYYRPGAFVVTTPKGSVVANPSLDMEALAKSTGARVPVVGADWFITQTSSQEGKTPGYYDFLGIKDEAGFQKLIGVNGKEKIQLSTTVARSGITLFPRVVAMLSSRTGGYWITNDFASIDGARTQKNRDATEQIGILPNGLPAFLLAGKDGKVQDVAPGNIASNGDSATNDKRVHVYKSCWQCHGNGGLRDLSNEFTSAITRDRAGVDDTMKRIAGISSREYSAALVGMIDAYEDSDAARRLKEYEQ